MVLDWGLNSGPPALEASTLPLGYRGDGEASTLPLGYRGGGEASTLPLGYSKTVFQGYWVSLTDTILTLLNSL